MMIFSLFLFFNNSSQFLHEFSKMSNVLFLIVKLVHRFGKLKLNRFLGIEDQPVIVIFLEVHLVCKSIRDLTFNKF